MFKNLALRGDRTFTRGSFARTGLFNGGALQDGRGKYQLTRLKVIPTLVLLGGAI